MVNILTQTRSIAEIGVTLNKNLVEILPYLARHIVISSVIRRSTFC